MSYKIKVKPEDFIVKELNSLPLKNKGEYGVFVLKKTGYNTVDLLKRISQKFKIPFENISYGGKKDRHAVTEQFFTIKNPPKNIYFKEDSYSIKLIGFSDKSMDPRFIEGNLFKITVRALTAKAVEAALFHIEKVKEYGFINYFDDQRFGSFDPKQGFIAEKILKGHYNGALKIYLTHIYPEDKKQTKERKKYIFENWTNWKECFKVGKTKFERLAFSYLIKNPNDYITLLRKIPREEMSMCFSSYQSFLWNETVRKLVCALFNNEKILSHKGIAGNYIFFNDPDRETYQYLKSLRIPTTSSKANMPDSIVEKLYKEVLYDQGIRPSMFNLKKIRQAFFKSVDRIVLVIPKSLKYKIEDDEIYEGKNKLVLEFVLPRGSYATMLIKRIFAKNKKS